MHFVKLINLSEKIVSEHLVNLFRCSEEQGKLLAKTYL